MPCWLPSRASCVVASPRVCGIRESVPSARAGEGACRGPCSPGRSDRLRGAPGAGFGGSLELPSTPGLCLSAEQAHGQQDLRCLSTSAVASRALTRADHHGVLSRRVPPTRLRNVGGGWAPLRTLRFLAAFPKGAALSRGQASAALRSIEYTGRWSSAESTAGDLPLMESTRSSKHCETGVAPCLD